MNGLRYNAALIRIASMRKSYRESQHIFSIKTLCFLKLFLSRRGGSEEFINKTFCSLHYNPPKQGGYNWVRNTGFTKKMFQTCKKKNPFLSVENILKSGKREKLISSITEVSYLENVFEGRCV